MGKEPCTLAPARPQGHGLQEKGYKLTRQRRELLAVLDAAHSMLSAEEIHQRVLSSQAGVSLSTIYRNLELLQELDLICKLDLGDGHARYERRRDTAHHHHLICLACGATEQLECPLGTLVELVKQKQFTVTGHRFEVYGYCHHCKPAS